MKNSNTQKYATGMAEKRVKIGDLKMPTKQQYRELKGTCKCGHDVDMHRFSLSYKPGACLDGGACAEGKKERVINKTILNI